MERQNRHKTLFKACKGRLHPQRSMFQKSITKAMRKSVIPKPQNEKLQQAAADYKKQLIILGHSASGSQNKCRHVLEMMARLEQAGITDLKIVTTADIQKHLQYLRNRPNYNQGGQLSDKSLVHHIHAIQLFFSQLQANGKISQNPASSFFFKREESHNSRTILSQQQIRQLYEATHSHQEKAILSLSYGCGLRAIELESLNLEDVKTAERTVYIRKGKGNKSRTVPFNHKIAQHLESYLEQERPELTRGKDYQSREQAPDETGQAFMLHSRGGRMHYYTWNKYLKRLAARAGLSQEISLHMLRHSIASHLLEQGIKVTHVRDFLGHSQLETTQIYTHISKQQLKNLT